MKNCKKCNIEKPLEAFNKDSKNKDGLWTICKECRYGYKPHKPILTGLKCCFTCKEEKDITFFKKHTSGNTYESSCKKCRNRAREFRVKDKPKHKIRKHKLNYKAKLKARYGISIDTYNEMLENQNNKCLICNNPETLKNRTGNIRRLSVDHCHDTQIVRGLLCSKCNHGLGMFKDKVSNLLKAIEYLKSSNTDKS